MKISYVFGAGWRGFGHRPSPVDRPGRVAFSRTSVKPTTSPSLASYLGPVLDQGETSSCTGHAGATACYAVSAITGHALPWFPSPRGIYVAGNSYTRALETPSTDDLPPLVDEGAYLPDVVKAMSRDGVFPIGPRKGPGFSDADARTVVTELTLGENERRDVHVLEHRIITYGAQRLADVVAALDAGMPIMLGTFVDSKVLRFVAGDPPVSAPNRGDTHGGGHAAVLHTATRSAAGVYTLRVRSSWGSGFGISGDMLADEGWLASVDELHAIGWDT